MNTDYNISIPQPCHEDWNAMTPTKGGRFCSSCTKTVIDFTTKSDQEIQTAFRKDKNLCGRFKKTQLEGLTITIPSRLLHQRHSFHKSFILAVFIAMGTTLVNCTTTGGKSQAIDTIVVIENAEVAKSQNITKISDSLKKSCVASDSSAIQPPPTPVRPPQHIIAPEHSVLMGLPVFRETIPVEDTLKNPPSKTSDTL